MSRNQILEKIRQNKPVPAPLPDIPEFFRADADAVSEFIQTVENGGGKVLPLSELAPWITAEHPDATLALSFAINPSLNLNGLPVTIIGNETLKALQSPGELNPVDLAVVPSSLGVAENGAVWVTEQDSIHRILPFITQHLAIILQKNSIVQNMHQAYRRIRVDETGFGVFIAGPSKTADIEQALVIGAQGARSFTVFLME